METATTTALATSIDDVEAPTRVGGEEDDDGAAFDVDVDGHDQFGASTKTRTRTRTRTKTTDVAAVTTKTVGICASSRLREIDEEYHDDDGSAETVFSLDSCGGDGGERGTLTTNATVAPIRIRGVASRVHNQRERRLPRRRDGSTMAVLRGEEGNSSSPTPPFASDLEPSVEYDAMALNASCPCRCMYFALIETACLVMSAMGCGLFLVGLVFLCMYLAGGGIFSV